MTLINYNKFKFLKEEGEYIKENSIFNQYQMGIEPTGLGPGYGFASDPTMSIYSDGSSPYVDQYARSSRMVNDISRVMNDLQGSIISQTAPDYFIEDLDEYGNLKILRIFQNYSLKIDVYISFDFYGEEFFGVFKDFNGLKTPPNLNSELFSDPRYPYIDREYYLKLNNYLYKIVYNWFIPEPDEYVNKKDGLILKNDMGDLTEFKENKEFKVVGYNVDSNNNPFIILKHKDKIYYLDKTDYYYFNYWFEKKHY